MKIKIITLLLMGVVSTISVAQNKDNMTEFDHTFAHVVYFWFKNPDNQDDRAKFEASLKKFLDNSQYAKTKFIGKPPKAIRAVVDDSFTYSLVLTFDSAEAQAAYQVEPPHLIFIEECEDLWEKVIVYDSEGI
ncbi:Dabb family protein [Flagellimonas aequoris]|uniref:Dabb family protein n=1 Tax=Flagellimonas aequoris TaxID=2306997 RepID=A0A418NC96_9FLAO|nr:Dabb family protein [Allomuricauda aequoris]RIV73687.1 Dabb family protein [Allomuricauda aequoris]TXK07371.1 Dabb family protein [Allomuricauda aequoris]